MKRIFLVLIFLFVAGTTSLFEAQANDPSAEEAAIKVEGAMVAYVGRITENNIERFLDAVKGKKISVLVISSGGGEINAGMEMGEWVFDHGVDVVVERLCASSCANYVFTAGRHKTIRPDSIVAWHGSILQESGMSDEDVRAAAAQAYDRLPEIEKREIDMETLIRQSIHQMREYRAESAARQARFFKKIGVDEYICRVGNERFGARDFFVLSIKDMARFGVLNVTAPGNYEKMDLAPFLKKGKSVEFIRLDR